MAFTPKDIARYRKYPVIAAKELLDIDLVWYQRICLRSMWSKNYVVLMMGRGCGKTFLDSIYLVLQALLYPGNKCGSLSASYRQASFVIKEIENLYNHPTRGRVLRQEAVKPPSMGRSEAIIKFKNGSYVKALPLSHKARGERFYVIVLDEYAQIPEFDIQTIVRPMLNAKREIGKNTESNNTFIITSTAFYKWNHFYSVVQDYRAKKESKSPMHDILEFDIDDGIEAGVIEPSVVEEQRRDMPEELFMMEHYNYFPDEMDGFVRYSLLQKVADKDPFPVEMKGEDDFEYVLGVDVARSEGGDNFAIAVYKIINKVQKQLVRVYTLNGASYQDMRDSVRLMMALYNVIRIYTDSQGGGVALQDLLAEENQLCPLTGDSIPPVLLVDGDPDANGLRILQLVDPSAKINHEMGIAFKKDLQQGNLTIPKAINNHPDEEIERANLQIKMTFTEIASIQAKPNGNYFKFILPKGDSKLRKDRWSACLLGNYGINEMFKEEEVEELGFGGWLG